MKHGYTHLLQAFNPFIRPLTNSPSSSLCPWRLAHEHFPWHLEHTGSVGFQWCHCTHTGSGEEKTPSTAGLALAGLLQTVKNEA